MKTRTAKEQAVITAFGARLRELRKSRSFEDGSDTNVAYMPQKEAARRAGLDPTYWGRLETGKSEPTLTSLLKIQRGLQLDSIESLLGPTASIQLAYDLRSSDTDQIRRPE